MENKKEEKRYETTTILKTGDRLRTPKGHLIIITNIWVERFHTESITYIAYDFISVGGHTGSEQKTIGALQAFLHTESTTKKENKIKWPEEVKINWVDEDTTEEVCCVCQGTHELSEDGGQIVCANCI